MSRKAEFSLLYEIAGLVVFSIVSLVWFGGLEMILGGFNTNKAVQTFNSITNAVSTQCLADSQTPEVLLTGLDLTVYGSTFIMTQLRIPEILTTDAETMGFLQPPMRKCIGANCLCLMELKEPEWGWYQCTTSDFDSSNYYLGWVLGPPGCPFWYYAPPAFMEQAVQGLLDFLLINGMDVILGFSGNTPDPTEHYSYPAPERWGGCSKATEANLSITSFTRETSTFECSELVDLTMNQYGVYESDLKTIINYEFTEGNINDLMKEKLNQLSSRTYTVLLNEFTKEASNKLMDIYSSIILNKLIEVSNCSPSVLDEIFSNHDQTSIASTNFYDLSMSDLEINYEHQNTALLSKALLSLTAKEGTLEIISGTCGFNNLIDESEERIEYELTPECITGKIEISGNAKLKLKTGVSGIISGKDVAINLTFTRKYPYNQLLDYAISEAATAILEQAFNNSPLNLTEYQDEVSNQISILDFSNSKETAKNTMSTYYDALFTELSTKPIYLSTGEGCVKAEDIPRNMSISYPLLRTELINSVNNEVLNKISNELSLDINSFGQINNLENPVYNNINQAISDFSQAIANNTYELIICNGDLSIENYALMLNESLKEQKNELINSLNEALSNNRQLDILSNGFNFLNAFNNEIITYSSSGADQFIQLNQYNINQKIFSASKHARDLIEIKEQDAWKNDPFFQVNCWPMVNSSDYFKGFPSVNDLLGWRRYTSVARLEPFLISFSIDAARRVTLAAVDGLYKKIMSNSQSTKLFVPESDRKAALTQLEDAFSKSGTVTMKPSTLASILDAVLPSVEAVMPFQINQDVNQEFLETDYSLITGNNWVKNLIKKIGSKITKESIKNFIVSEIKSLILTTIKFAISAGFNFWKNSVMNQFNSEVVLYSHGGIRTFDPELIKVHSCVRLDELGCSKDEGVWVNESFNCQTDVYTRRLFNIATWINFLKGNDKCQVVNETSGFIDGVKYVNTLTSCYKLSCEVTEPVDRYKVFQYWVGAQGDPAGLLGSDWGKIQLLRVYKASTPETGNVKKVMMEVIGGDYENKVPPGIV